VTPDETSGQTVFGYKAGAYSDVTFNKEGRVIASTQYTMAQQLAQKTSLPDATDFLRKNKLSWTRLSLLNGNSILVDIPTLDNATAPLFDSKDKLHGTYTFLYPKILDAASKSPPVADFYKTLKGMYLGSGDYPQSGVGGKSGKLTFTMPDIAGGSIVATLDATGKLVQPKPEFTGSRPASFSTTQSGNATTPAAAAASDTPVVSGTTKPK
jgi:hypothetical protein